MATKAEQFRSEAQRSSGARRRKPRTAKKRPKKSAWGRDKAHAAAKAVYALETTAPGKRPSRESTRRSANRSKPDTAFNLTEAKKKGAPAARARKARARTAKVRGSTERPA